jgi:hypothetical protein
MYTTLLLALPALGMAMPSGAEKRLENGLGRTPALGWNSWVSNSLHTWRGIFKLTMYRTPADVRLRTPTQLQNSQIYSLPLVWKMWVTLTSTSTIAGLQSRATPLGTSSPTLRSFLRVWKQLQTTSTRSAWSLACTAVPELWPAPDTLAHGRTRPRTRRRSLAGTWTTGSMTHATRLAMGRHHKRAGRRLWTQRRGWRRCVTH